MDEERISAAEANRIIEDAKRMYLEDKAKGEQ